MRLLIKLGRTPLTNRLVKRTTIVTVDFIIRLVTLAVQSIKAALAVKAKGTAPLTNPEANSISISQRLSLHLLFPLMALNRILVNTTLTNLASATIIKASTTKVRDTPTTNPSSESPSTCQLAIPNSRKSMPSATNDTLSKVTLNHNKPYFAACMPCRLILQTLKCAIVIPQNSMAITPEQPSIQLVMYDMQPVRKIRAISVTPLSRRMNRPCLNSSVRIKENATPMEIDTMIISTNLPRIWKGVYHWNQKRSLLPETVTSSKMDQYSTIVMASLISDQPNIMENNFGCDSGLISLSEATGSTLHIQAAKSSICQISNFLVLVKSLISLTNPTISVQLTCLADSVDQQRDGHKVEYCAQKPIDINVIDIVKEPPLSEVIAVCEQHRWQQNEEDDCVVEVQLSRRQCSYHPQEVVVEQEVDEQPCQEPQRYGHACFVQEPHLAVFEQG